MRIASKNTMRRLSVLLITILLLTVSSPSISAYGTYPSPQSGATWGKSSQPSSPNKQDLITSVDNDAPNLPVKPMSEDNLTDTSTRTDKVNVKDYGAVGDGTTNDSIAVKKALDAALKSGSTLYFPAGTYNLNMCNGNEFIHIDQDLKILGEGSKTVLYNPGKLICSQSVSIEDITITYSSSNASGIFLELKPTNFVDVTLNGVMATTQTTYNTNFKFLYVDEKSPDKGIDTLSVENCRFSKMGYALQIMTTIHNGYIGYNTITEIGSPTVRCSLGGILLGSNEGVHAHNIKIEHNTITDFYTTTKAVGEGPDEEIYALPIMVYGQDIIIANNYIEGLNGGYENEGIYVKAKNVDICYNTLINAGDEEGSICAKASTNVRVYGNIIKSYTPPLAEFRGTCGIYLMGTNIEVFNNTIDISWGTGIELIPYENMPQGVVNIENNFISTSGSGITLKSADGPTSIINNTIDIQKNSEVTVDNSGISILSPKDDLITIQNNHIKASYARGLDLGINGGSPTAAATVKDNTFDITQPIMPAIVLKDLSFTFENNKVVLSQNATTSTNVQSAFLDASYPASFPASTTQKINNNNFYFSGSKTTCALLVHANSIEAKNNSVYVYNGQGLDSFMYFRPTVSTANGNTIENNTVNGCTLRTFLYIDTKENIPMGDLLINKNVCNFTDQLVSPSPWNSAINIDKITISENRLGTNKPESSAYLYPSHQDGIQIDTINNKLYANLAPQSALPAYPS